MPLRLGNKTTWLGFRKDCGFMSLLALTLGTKWERSAHFFTDHRQWRNPWRQSKLTCVGGFYSSISRGWGKGYFLSVTRALTWQPSQPECYSGHAAMCLQRIYPIANRSEEANQIAVPGWEHYVSARQCVVWTLCTGGWCWDLGMYKRSLESSHCFSYRYFSVCLWVRFF